LVILLLGPPGSGKGTQSPYITRLLNIPAISTGEMLRAESEAGTPLGKEASAILAAGHFVSDAIVNGMLVNRISQDDCRNGFLLDGYPRTVPQADFLDDYLSHTQLGKPVVIHLATPNYVLVERISARRQCPKCGTIYNQLFKPPKKRGFCDLDGTPLIRRQDDSPEVVEERLVTYNKLTAPVIEFYRDGHGYYYPVKADRAPGEIQRDIDQILRLSRNGNSAKV
jgi:adenylate kinase